MFRSRIALALVPFVTLAVQATPARAVNDVLSTGDLSLDISGYLEARAIYTGDNQSWENGGLGKLSFSGNAKGDGRVLAKADGAVVFKPKLGFDWTGYVAVVANDRQRTALDISEAFLQYKPVPNTLFGIKAKAGAFFPPISGENAGLAWTSPYTITPSAINSWVGEELKTIGGEATIYHREGDWQMDLTGAVFLANDPAGTLLAWRGWSLNDRVTGLFDKLSLAQIRIIRPTGNLNTQAPTEKPFHEIDGHAGYYVGLSLEHADYGKLSVLRYDNKANDHAFVLSQWAWDTKFWTVSYKVQLSGDVDVLTQYMKGSTTVITIPAPVGPIVYTDYTSAFGLISKDWGRHRLSFRGEYFKTEDEDRFPDNNNEHGTAFTLAYIFRPVVNQRLTVELLHVDSWRPERQYIGERVRQKDLQTQISYRFFF